MKKSISGVFLLLFLTFSAAGNGLNLNGIGSKAIAMGGAFVALADDYSAVFWNPAGLTYMEGNSISFYGVDILAKVGYKFDLLSIKAESFRKSVFSGMAAFYYDVNEDLKAGIALYIPSGLAVEWDGSQLKNLTGGKLFSWKSKIFLIAISPAIAYKLNDWVSAGAALNVYYGTMNMERGVILMNTYPSQYKSSGDGFAIGATAGIIVEPIDFFQFGISMRTPFKTSLSGETTIDEISRFGFNETSQWESSVNFPAWIAAGLAIFPTEDLTLTFDLQWTGWSNLEEIVYDFKDSQWRVLFEAREENKIELNWESKLQIRLGVEYFITEEIALRAGYYFDPSPVPERTLNILLPSSTFNAITFGAGYIGERFAVEFAGEYLAGKDRKVPVGEGLMPGDYSMNVLSFSFALTYFF